jgi:peptide deformylase
MSALPILTIGDPRLRTIARPVDRAALASDLALGRAVASSLASFRRDHGWGRGLAAPQVAVPIRMVAFDIGAGPFLALDPEITWRSVEMATVIDDCLCLPGIAAPVERHVSVSMRYFDEKLEARTLEQLPFDLAELMQHEIDHLDGILFVDRITTPSGIVAREHKSSPPPTAT